MFEELQIEFSFISLQYWIHTHLLEWDMFLSLDSVVWVPIGHLGATLSLNMDLILPLNLPISTALKSIFYTRLQACEFNPPISCVSISFN